MRWILFSVVALAFASWLAFGTESWQAFFHWMPMFSQAFLTEGKAPWWKLQSIFALVRYFGGTEQLAWGFQWVLTASVAVVLALMWRGRVPYTVKAAALAVGTLLTTPYLFMYDVMVLAIPVAFLVRIGLKRGFRPYELPALGCANRSPHHRGLPFEPVPHCEEGDPFTVEWHMVCAVRLVRMNA